MIKNGSVVSVNYTGKLNGEIFDSSEGKSPLVFTVGSGQIIPGFEKAIIDKNVGDVISVEIEPSEAYGEYRDDLVAEVSKDQLPGPVEPGQPLQANSEDGSIINVFVKEVFENHVTIDGNHPFAGRTILFDIQILDVKD